MAKTIGGAESWLGNEISEIFVKYLLCAGMCCAMLLHPSLTGRAHAEELPPLTELNIEELMNIEVYSVYNLFDYHYGDPGSDEHPQYIIEQDGRTFRGKLTYRF